MATKLVTTVSYNGELQGEKEGNSPALGRRVSLGSVSSSQESVIAPSSYTVSSSSSSSSPSPSLSNTRCSKECVSAALDQYVAVSMEGRDAFSHGLLQSAVKDFDQALAIELQTELDCLYDTSIGFMSGLVRSEVDSKLQQHHRRDSVKCSRILQQLKETFYKAADGLGKKHTEPKWYLQMGASLVMINEWEKAKAVYTEGINMCKDRKSLKHALKNLIKIEQMTSYADIPVEDQPDSYFNSHSPACSPYQSPRPSPMPSPAPSPKRSPIPSPRRDRSKSVAMRHRKLRENRDRTASLSLECNINLKGEELHRKSSDITMTTTLNIGLRPSTANKRLSFGGLFSSKKPSLLSLDTTSKWSTCFDPATCKVIGQTEFKPSAITHMRKLSSLDMDGADDVDDDDGTGSSNSVGEPLHSSGRFNAVKITSLRIEDDDSELDDSD